MENIIVGGAWPYANGSLHIGHIAALLPGDVLARYFRAKGNCVFYVSGSDCHGTPITIRAKQENSTPEVISEHYHKEFCDVFKKLGFSYDLYTKTSDPRHKEFVSKFHKRLYKSDYIEERTVKQAFCPACKKVLTDRLIVGICPACGSATRGDQCDTCGEVLDADTVINAKCADCGAVLGGRPVEAFEVDHFINEDSFPDTIEGRIEAGKISNLAWACVSCNRGKRGITIEPPYDSLLNVDNGNITHVFRRDEDFYIRICDTYQEDEFIQKFYHALHLGYETRRLDYFALKLEGKCNEEKDENRKLVLLEQLKCLRNRRNHMAVSSGA